jgi:hypothetical protein
VGLELDGGREDGEQEKERKKKERKREKEKKKIKREKEMQKERREKINREEREKQNRINFSQNLLRLLLILFTDTKKPETLIEGQKKI